MQQQIDALGWPMEVHILGVNEHGHGGNNASACEGKDIPWLQEGADDAVWDRWNIAYRDVVILDKDNKLVGTYNLTAHNLSDSGNFDALKAMLQAATGAK